MTVTCFIHELKASGSRLSSLGHKLAGHGNHVLNALFGRTMPGPGPGPAAGALSHMVPGRGSKGGVPSAVSDT